MPESGHLLFSPLKLALKVALANAEAIINGLQSRSLDPDRLVNDQMFWSTTNYLLGKK